jgi:hypothetical protein
MGHRGDRAQKAKVNVMISLTLRSSFFAIFFLVPFMLMAQSQNLSAAADEQLLKSEELDALVAPVALYPDTLLAEVLMASTYPIEVVQAELWVTENKKLKGDQLKAAVDKQAWDESVKSLVATPSVLAMMSSKLDWTQKLGDTVLAQQADVMDAIQRLRLKAQANNKLSSTKEQKVTVTQEENKQVIIIEPTDPEIIYVPYYDPIVVYGGWPYPAYPPYYFPPPVYISHHISHPIIAAGIAFGTGYLLGRWASGGNYWGGGVNWGGNNININRPININNIGNNWQHRPEHRQGVRYNNANVQQRFGNNNIRTGSQQRMEYRGRGGEQPTRPGGGSANLGGRGGSGRPSAGAGASRPGAGDRVRGGPGAVARPSSGSSGLGRGDAFSSINNPSGLGRGDAFSSISNPSGLGRGDAFSNIQSGRATNLQSQRGQASLGSSGGFRGGGSLSGGGSMRTGGGGMRAGGGGGMGAGGGRGGGRGGGSGRRSDMRLKHDITTIGRLDNGLGYYRFVYNGDDKAYVGVMAQEVLTVTPEAVVRGRDGYLRVFYEKLGLKFETYDQWITSGARIPSTARVLH